ncbi:MAG: hypothetical protein WAM70_02415 [Pyrinomonadaceae bacterium]
MKAPDPETSACSPIAVDPAGFNPAVVLPYGLTIEHIAGAMTDFIYFLRLVNTGLHAEKIPRLESIMMSANFSSLVGEFMNAGIPKYCKTLAKNTYHNGHPDMIPAGMFPGNSVQHAAEGVEVKASRYFKSWQGHNAEDTWLMVFVYDSNRVKDGADNPRPFQFIEVLGARLVKADWLFAGRSATSRRTITASVTTAGYAKMNANWIYRAPKLKAPKNTAQSKPAI